jgi:hypothetical protein
MTHLPAPSPLRVARKVLSGVVFLGVSLTAYACAPAEEPTIDWRSEPLDGSFLDPGGMPHLSAAGDGAVLSWWTPVEAGYALRAVVWDPDTGFGPLRTVTEGADFFVNWADFPSVVEVAPGKWVAHWLQRNGEGTFAYGVRVAVSQDAGDTWSDPWTPHEDLTPTEHGFVTVWPEGEGAWALVWLDGRKYADGPHGAATSEMTIRARSVAADGTPQPEAVLDHRACDCCQTDVAATDRGPVVVYRDRTDEEVRDIYLARKDPSGWTPGRAVHDDGWVIGGCPVNGPAADALGSDVVVAWFTGAQDAPRVHVAFSRDAGDTFQAPVRVDDGRPVGRVDVTRLADGSALVTWLEAVGETGAEIRVRRVQPDGALGAAWTLTSTSAARSSGFPQFVPVAGGRFLAAWTEVLDDGASRVRLAVVTGP